VDENKSVQAWRKGSKHLVLFDEVDVSTAIELYMAGHKQPIGYIIRAANTRTFREIHQGHLADLLVDIWQVSVGAKDIRRSACLGKGAVVASRLSTVSR
jgi:hypothetical protein